jgi:quercetin dioxygenase-like cupin family protein
MAHVGQEISNPRTGQRMKFVELEPDLLRIDSVSPASNEPEPLHVHPRQESGAELLSGSLVFEVDGVQRRLEPGDSIAIPAGTPHRFWNDGEQDAHWSGYFRPALASAEFFETLFALAGEDKLDAKGMPRPLQLAVMVPAFAEEIRPVSPPWPLLRVGAAMLAPLARARGYRGKLASRA